MQEKIWYEIHLHFVLHNIFKNGTRFFTLSFMVTAIFEMMQFPKQYHTHQMCHPFKKILSSRNGLYRKSFMRLMAHSRNFFVTKRERIWLPVDLALGSLFKNSIYPIKVSKVHLQSPTYVFSFSSFSANVELPSSFCLS